MEHETIDVIRARLESLADYAGCISIGGKGQNEIVVRILLSAGRISEALDNME